MTAEYNPGYTYWTDFLFQAMFAATAATIVSGAVAERVKLGSFLLFATIYVMFVYPVIGSWKWGGGWLDALGFYDFAGSTIVHSVGGWAALAGVIFLGPRLGKYVNGEIRPILGHNLPLAVMGMFLLWLGWFGFNGGSVLSADPGLVSFVLVTTSLAAAAGIVGAMATTWVVHRHPDASMVLNGALAGLVGITAGADVLSVTSAVIIGLVAGVIVVISVETFDRAKLDDPVGAISVHLTCGVWGTLAVGIFSADHSLLTQLVGVAACGAVAFPAAAVIFLLLRSTIGLRVSPRRNGGVWTSRSTTWKPTRTTRSSRLAETTHPRRECMMKLVIAYVQPDRLHSVKEALAEVEVGRMSVTNALGCGQQGGFTETYRGADFEVRLRRKVRFEIAVNDNFLERTRKAIIKGARTGNIGDGVIFVLDLAECYRIRTGEEGSPAIG